MHTEHLSYTNHFRSKKWVEKCERQDLMDKSPGHLYRYYRVCGKHFEPSSIDTVSYVCFVERVFSSPVNCDN